MAENDKRAEPNSDMPPPRKPPGRTATAGMGGDGDKRRKRFETVRIALPPKPSQGMPPASGAIPME